MGKDAPTIELWVQTLISWNSENVSRKIVVGWFQEYVKVTAFRLAVNTKLLHKWLAVYGTFIEHPSHFDKNDGHFTKPNDDHHYLPSTATPQRQPENLDL